MRPRFRRWLSRALARASAATAEAPGYHLVLDYPIQPRPRWGDTLPGHPQLTALLASGDISFRQTLASLSPFTAALERIPESEDHAAPGEPYWLNSYFSSLDAIALYGLLASHRPSHYLEIGSGHSTRFARRAIRDHRLPTRITSLDPQPRADVDTLCDEVIRRPLEDADAGIFERLQPGDFLFADNSHRVFMNSDATVFFLEILPRLPPGVVVHVHDIFLPFDYPRPWARRYYSEQYLLAAFLLGGGQCFDVLLPLVYLSRHPTLGELVCREWSSPPFQRAFDHYRRLTGGHVAASFWLLTK